MFRPLVLLLGLASLVAAKPTNHLFEGTGPSEIHAVLISGVPYDNFPTNYAPEAEVARTYHWLVEHGVPADNIILFMNGRFANSSENPEPGTLYADTEKSRNYAEGLKIDYSGEEVSPQNFLAVIQGEKDKVKGGSGRVLSSTEKNRVFISHEGHGNTGLLEVNGALMYVEDLQNALKNMEKKKMFSELLYYVMACYSGSMFNEQLDENGKIYAFTAASPELEAKPKDILNFTVGGKIYEVCVSTEFGDAWLDNVEKKNTKEETLDQQYNIVVPQVTSDPQRYGNMKIGKEPVANFEGVNTNTSEKLTINNKLARERNDEDRIPIAPIAKYLLLQRKLKNSKSFAEQQDLKEQLRKMEAERDQIDSKINSILEALAGKGADFKGFREPPAQVMQRKCHRNALEAVWSECKGIKDSPFVYEFVAPVTNLCEQHYPADKIIEQIKKQSCTKMESAIKFLEKRVIEDGQCVTKMTVLRQTSLKATEIEGLMRGFYEKHKGLPLSAMFVIFGTKKTETGVVRHSMVCKHDELEKVKADFEKVASVSVFSLYRDPTLDIQGLLNIDWAGKYQKPVAPFVKRLGIVCDLANDASGSTDQRYPPMTVFEIPPFMMKVKVEPISIIKSMVCRDTQNSLNNASANATAPTEADENMEIENAKESERKRENTNKAKVSPVDKKPKTEDMGKTSKPLKKLPRGQSSIGSFFSKK